MSETKRECAASYRKPPLHTCFKKGQSGNPRGRPKKNLPALLVTEPAYVATNGRRRRITKREVKLKRRGSSPLVALRQHHHRYLN